MGSDIHSNMKHDRFLPGKRFPTWTGYLFGLGLVGVVSLLGIMVHAFFDVTNIAMAFLLVVVTTAAVGGIGPSILASVLSVGILDYIFVPPFLSFGPPNAEHAFTLVVFLVIGLITSSLTSRIRNQWEVARNHERHTAALYSLSRTLADSVSLDDTIRAIVGSARRILGGEAVIFLLEPAGKVKVYTDSPDASTSAAEIEAAARLLRDRDSQGLALAASHKTRYFRLVSAGKTVGVIAIPKTTAFTTDQERLLEAFADLAAVSIERTQLADQAQQTEILKATEKLQTALLNSISHDLRTPLVSVIGVLSSLQEERMNLDDAVRSNLIQVGREEAERLNRLVTNLLNMSRLESGVMKISRQPCDVQDLIGAALEQLAREANDHPIQIDAPASLPTVSADFGLMAQTLVNILDNALKYSAPGSPVNITARSVGSEVEIDVADNGTGIPQADLVHVFDKFYRAQNTNNVAGTGLGLSICKGIVEAHGGHVAAGNRPGGGTIIKLVLPAGGE